MRQLYFRYLFRNYRLLHRLVFRFRQRFTAAGVFVLAGIVVSAAMGVDTNQAMAYQAFTFLTLLLLFSIVLSRFGGVRIEVRRRLPAHGSAGTALTYRIEVRNPTRRPLRGVVVQEIFEGPIPTLEEFMNLREPEEHRRNWFDRLYKYYRWRWLVRRREIARARIQSLPDLPPQTAATASLELEPCRRGVLRLRRLAVLRPDPLGLFRSLMEIELPDKLLVLPERYAVPDLDLPGNRMHQPGGMVLASSVGESEEFMSLREYRPGDPLRHIHWKSWARVGQPIVKEFQEENFVRHALVLDTFESGIDEVLFEAAVSLAASFACTIQTQESLLDLLFVGTEAYCFTSGRSLGQTAQMLEILAGVRPCVSHPFRSLEYLVAGHADKVSGCLCILLKWDGERSRLLRRLEAQGVPLRGFLLCHETADNSPEISTEDLPAMVQRVEIEHLEDQLNQR